MNTIYDVLRLLAFSDGFHDKANYDSHPLECIRKGAIKSMKDLKSWFGSHQVPLVPQATKFQIK